MTFASEWLKSLGDPRSERECAESIQRLAESYEHFARGYQMEAAKIITEGLMPSGAAKGQTITIAPIPFYSLCEHHLLPFFGTAEVEYTAGEYILGLGKFPKVVEALSARITLQENLTAAIADAITVHLKPTSMTVTLTARHLCLEMRGTHMAGMELKTQAIR